MAKFKQEELETLSNHIDTEMSDSYNYASSELYDQMGEAWRRYFRQPYGNEVEGFSDWVSPMIMNHVNDTRAFITSTLTKSGRPILKFRPKSPDDVMEADLASQYINDLFMNKLDGYQIIDNTVFNAALLKICPVRVRMHKETSKEVLKFEYSGYDVEEFQDRLALFFVANPKLQDEDPYDTQEVGIDNPNDDGYIYACYKWESKEEIDCYPTVDVISPGNFFVSRQAESLKEARLVAHMHEVTVSELAELYPDAPRINGHKSKKAAEEFWEDLDNGYQTWYSEKEWLAKWDYDSLGFYQEQDSLDADNLGVGSKKIFVIDAEVFSDPMETGHSQWYHVVKVGNTVLHASPIQDTSFVCGSLLPTGNRWLGIGLYDVLSSEAKEETLNVRAYTDATVQAAHVNLVVDPDQVEMDDIENLGPDDVIRMKPHAGSKQVQPVDVLKKPGPDPSVLQAAEQFNKIGSMLTGVGAAFAGASQDELSSMRMDKESVKSITNRSSLLLNYMSRNYADFLSQVMVKLFNTAVRGTASKAVIEFADKWQEVDPSAMQPRHSYVLTADVGVDDQAEREMKLAKAMEFLQATSGGGGQLPDGTPIPAINVQTTPLLGYEIARMFFEANDLPNFEGSVVDPNLPQGQEQVQTVIQQIQQQIPAMIQQGVQQAIETAMQAPEVQKVQAEIAKIQAETDQLMDAGEEKVFNAANNIEAEERREEAEAWKAAAAERDSDINQQKVDDARELKLRELETQERIASKAQEVKATAVVSP